MLAYVAQQLDARHLVQHPASWEAAVRDDPQGVVGKVFVQRPCLLVVACQHNLWPAAHTQSFQLRVQGLGGKLQALLQHELVQIGQDAGVEAHVVLHHQDHLHARLHVVLQVHLVLDQLDDAEQQLCVAQPAKHVFEGAHVLVGQRLLMPWLKGVSTTHGIFGCDSLMRSVLSPLKRKGISFRQQLTMSVCARSG